jgi:hypothetical protein
MKHRTMNEINEVARVGFTPRDGPYDLRAARLRRLADLLELHQGLVRLLSRVEYVPKRKRALLREDESPLSIAFRDPEFLRQGLQTERLGDSFASRIEKRTLNRTDFLGGCFI